MALGAILPIAAPIIGGITWQTQAARDAGRCAHAQTLYQRVMSGDTGTATDWQGNNPKPILQQINTQRVSSATAAGKACYQQVWDALIAAGKVPGQGPAPGATPVGSQSPTPGSAGDTPPLAAGAAAVGAMPLWLVLLLAGGLGWWAYTALRKG
jgi:hypothetical protein